MDRDDILIFSLIMLGLVALYAVFGFILIWILNTLFSLSILYGFKQILAAALLVFILTVNVNLWGNDD